MFWNWLFIFCAASLIFSLILALVTYLFSVQILNLVKNDMYECGFKSFNNSRIMFNIQFFFVGILFVIFDLEIIFLFPWALYFDRLSYDGILIIFFFLTLLIVSYIYEIKEGLLSWVNV